MPAGWPPFLVLPFGSSRMADSGLAHLCHSLLKTALCLLTRQIPHHSARPTRLFREPVSPLPVCPRPAWCLADSACASRPELSPCAPGPPAGATSWWPVVLALRSQPSRDRVCVPACMWGRPCPGRSLLLLLGGLVGPESGPGEERAGG